LETNQDKFKELVEFDKDGLKELLNEIGKSPTLNDETSHAIFKKRNSDIKSNIKEKKEKAADEKLLKRLKEINNATLLALVRKEFLDIRFFGGAFAIGDFTKTITGSIQINTGYSLHPVELHHEAIATIMSGKDVTEGYSNFGKKEKVVYSLIAFTGTINAKRAEEVKLTDQNDLTDKQKKDNEESDVELFRNSIVPAIQYAATTDSKKNQYPKFYLEIEYIENEIYGRLGDLRHHIKVEGKQKNSKDEIDYKLVNRISHLNIDFTELYNKMEQIKDKIKCVKIWKAIGFEHFDEKKLKEILNEPESDEQKKSGEQNENDKKNKVETLIW